jgi:hypothetical protein
VWETSLSPSFRVYGDIEKHLVLCARSEVLEGDDREFGKDGECHDTTGILPDSKVFHLVIILEKVCARKEFACG